MHTEPFTIIPAQGAKLPIIVSVPHSGTEFPGDIKATMNAGLISAPDDTDWFVHQLYDFAPAMGITLIHARYSRWVIDLNRDPDNTPLYNDGRVITELTPTRTFLDQPLYVGAPPDAQEIERRLNLYYWPYYRRIREELFALRDEFGQVLLWDAHSIRRMVPTIRPKPFPDLILGDRDDATADARLIETALDRLSDSPFDVAHNDPFKGGKITRHFGRPSEGIHALQLEMTKTLYMDDSETVYDAERARIVRTMLQTTLLALADTLGESV